MDSPEPMKEPELPDMTVDLPSFGAREKDPRFQGIASSRGYKQPPNTRIQKLHYTHEALVDAIIANPTASHRELGEMFGYTASWMSRMINSDAFQAFMASRKSELTDPILAETIEERLKGVVGQSIEILAEKLELTRSADLALKTFDSASKALGFGARERGPQNVQNNFVVALPSKAPDAESWAKSYGGTQIEARPIGTTTTFDPLSQPKPMTIIEGSDGSDAN